MKLYYSPGTCALASTISLYEAGIPFQPVKVDLAAKKTESGEDYWKINPKGYVPALGLDTGEVLTENVAVLQYIADRKPEAKLAPSAGTMERYRLIEWLAFINSEIHKSLSTFFKPNVPEEWQQSVRELLAKRLGFLQNILNTRPYLMGDDFTIPDAYLFTVLRWHRKAGIDLAQFPAVKSYYERVQSRPKVIEALQAEGLKK